MKNNSKQESRPQKKPYAKPEVKQVQLRPEEAVLGACKSTTVAGPGGLTCSVLSCGVIGS